MRTYSIQENPYESVVVDVTRRCNMSCDFCWNWKRESEDISLSEFENLCKHLPSQTYLKLSGGEPTLHPQLPRLIEIGFGYGHIITVVSNGLKYDDPAFMDSLMRISERKTKFNLCIGLDGGLRNPNAYRAINGSSRYLEMKKRGLQNLLRYKVGRICLMALIVRGLNEAVVPELINMAAEHQDAVRYIHFRNAAKIGKWADTEPYSISEMKDIVARHFSVEEFSPKCFGEIYCDPELGLQCCYRFRPSRRLQVSIIEFASEEALQCHKRGRLVLGETRIKPFFQSML